MKKNLFDQIPAQLSSELLTVLAENDFVKIERIVSDNHASPPNFWYDQPQNEWVLLISGTATLSIETKNNIERVTLRPGDHLLIPAHQRHRVESTSSTEKSIWVTVHFCENLA